MAKRQGRFNGLKRCNAPENANTSKRSKRNHTTEDKIARSPSPSISEDSSEEALPSSNVTSEEIMVYKEPSMYDKLLMTLGSGNKAFANVYKRRKREEEGESDSEDDDGSSEAHSVSDEDEDCDSEEGSDNESGSEDAMGTDHQESIQAETVEHNDDAEIPSEDDTSETDQEDGLNDKGKSTGHASKFTSAFHVHLGHTLTKIEVEYLTKRKWKFQWEVHAADIAMSKWVGTGDCFLKESDYKCGDCIKPKLYKHFLDLQKPSGGKAIFSSRQRQFFTICNSYRDVLHCNKRPFYLKGFEEDSNIMDGYIMHALNHVFKTRDLVTKNEAKLAKIRENGKEEILNSDGFLDHGFTRPKVLILLPLASIALRVVKRLIQLTPPSNRVNVEHVDRFSDEFGTGDFKDNDDKNESHDEVSEKHNSSKPSDFQALFGGNNNDHFMIGIKYTRKSIKLYNDFYSSDMIVASPLGLITKIGEAEFEKEKDVDFLSSIEVLIIDHSDVIAMQNWSHVKTVVDHLNRIPSKQHGTDMMRIRQWYLEGHARFYRQTILLGSFLNLDMNALFNQHCLNYQGKVKLVAEYRGVLPKVLLQVRQIYERFDAESIVDADDARLDYFSKKVFPKMKDSIEGGTMLFISSYFEFVRIRNFLKSQDASFCMLGEYTKQSDISRARVWFFEGKRKIMLYTERAHFYHRYKIRGIKNLIIYSLPERKEFYPEIINMLEGSENMTCTILFSRFDKLRLERITGTTPAQRMISSEKAMFVFC